jgi:hypothetical protein
MLIHVTELTPHGARATVGFPLNSSYYDVPLPVAIDAPLVDDLKLLRIEPTGISSTPLAPAALTRFVTSLLPRYGRGPCAEGEALDRRRRLATDERRARPVELPARGVLPETCIARTVIECHLRERIESLALPPEIAVTTVTFAGAHAKSWTTEEVLDIAREIAEDEDGCLIPWDVDGHADDVRLAEAEAARQREEAARAIQEVRDAEVNTKSCFELGIVVMRFPRSIFEDSASGLVRLLPPVNLATKPLYRDRDYAYVAFNERVFLGLPLPAGLLRTSVGEVLPPTFVPLATMKELKEGVLYKSDKSAASAVMQSPAIRELAITLRVGSFSTEPITEFRDGSTPEGVWAEELAERACEPWLPYLRNGDGAASIRLLILNVMLRGVRLRPDCAHALFERMVRTHGVVLSVDRFNELAAKIVAGGNTALVGPDELWEDPEEDPGVWARVSSIFAPDAWRPTIETTIEGRSRVTSPELEEALLAAGLIHRELNPKEHGRIKRVMSALGWKKKIVPAADGRRTNAFIREGE